MPKDATKNVDRYKIRGGHLNEFEYTQNQKAVAEKKPQGRDNLIPGTPPEEAGDNRQPQVKARTSNATKGTKSQSTKATKARKAAKSTQKAKVNSTRGASPKKLAARKAAKKK